MAMAMDGAMMTAMDGMMATQWKNDGRWGGDAAAMTATVMEGTRGMEGVMAMVGTTATVAMDGATAMPIEDTTAV
jgi:hypothetical protein